MTDQGILVALNKSSLRKRLLRFFSYESAERQEISDFLDRCTPNANPLVFGGCIRDIAIFGVRQFASDIDIVFEGERNQLAEICKERNFTENKYGGFRGKLKSWDIDIWPISDTWAFKSNLVKFSTTESLLDTTIMNWDSIIFDWGNKKIICRDNYFKDLREGFLDIVLEENPNKLGATVKILRTITIKGTIYLSPAACSFLKKSFDCFNYQKILNKEFETYRTSFLNKRILSDIQEYAREGENSLIPIKISRYYHTEKLF